MQIPVEVKDTVNVVLQDTVFTVMNQPKWKIWLEIAVIIVPILSVLLVFVLNWWKEKRKCKEESWNRIWVSIQLFCKRTIKT